MAGRTIAWSLIVLLGACAGPATLAHPQSTSLARVESAPRPVRIDTPPSETTVAESPSLPVRIAPSPVRYGEVPNAPLPSYVDRVASDNECRTLFGVGPRYDRSAHCTGGQGADMFTVPQFWTPADPPVSP